MATEYIAQSTLTRENISIHHQSKQQHHPHLSVMASNIVLPTLTAWAEQHIVALFQATDEATFDEAFSAFFTKNAKITVNGQHVSLADYKKSIWQAKFLEAGAQVAFTGAVQVPSDADKPFDVSFSSSSLKDLC